MGKRSDFERKPRDYYPTIDPAAVKVFEDWGRYTYAEVCYGEGHLERLMREHTDLLCNFQGDIKTGVNALDLTVESLAWCQLIITNPPYSWDLLKPLLDHLPTLKPTLLLLPADAMHNKRMAPYMEKCGFIYSVGRLYWEDNKVKGKDNYCWYHFYNRKCTTVFRPRS